MKKLLFVLAIFPTFLFPQSRKERKALEAQRKADQVVINNLKNHTQNLTNDKTTGSGVVDYIGNQFKSIGLKPKSANGFIQTYSVDDGKKIAASTYLKINNNLLEVNKEYFPLPYSIERKVTGMPAMALRERGVPWFVDLKDLGEANAKTQVSSVEDLIKKETGRAALKGATALFVYNSSKSSDSLAFNSRDKSASTTIPVVYITQEGHKKYFSDHSAMLDVELNVAFKEGKVNGSNVMGYVDNSAPSTIVVGAHYDASNAVDPGINKDAKSTNIESEDNRGGIAMLIELARLLSVSKAKSNNYLFIAFGGPYKSSVPENYWLENLQITTPINYMINLDMAGGYQDNKKLSIQGLNSSPALKNLFSSIPDKKVEVNIDSVNAISEPYAAFSKKGIPQLLFTSTPQMEISMAKDEQAPINYAGELQIAKMISRLIEATDAKGKIVFAKISHRAIGQLK
jgi:aminopeptidase YwaD